MHSFFTMQSLERNTVFSKNYDFLFCLSIFSLILMCMGTKTRTELNSLLVDPVYAFSDCAEVKYIKEGMRRLDKRLLN